MLTAIGVLLVVALLFCILSAIGKAALWPSVLCVILVELLRILPLGR